MFRALFFPGIPPFQSRETGILKRLFSRDFPGREFPGPFPNTYMYVVLTEPGGLLGPDHLWMYLGAIYGERMSLHGRGDLYRIYFFIPFCMMIFTLWYLLCHRRRRCHYHQHRRQQAPAAEDLFKSGFLRESRRVFAAHHRFG